jgi:CubicO group peptidase (beta-lactamase class C family)
MTTTTVRNEPSVAVPRVARRHGLLARLLFFTMDLLYGRRLTLQKLQVLELVARVPYQAWEGVAYVALTHVHQRLPLARRIFDYVREARAAQDNEQWHLLIVNELIERSGLRTSWLFGRALPQVLAFVYYHVSWLLYVIAPRWSYALNADFEDHAEASYLKFVDDHLELESQPWTSAFAEDYGAHPTLAALFRQIARDEAEHRDDSLRRINRARFDAGTSSPVTTSAVILALSLALSGCTTTGMTSGAPATRASARVAQLVSSGEVPGIQYQVVGPEGVVFSSVAGVRDVASGAPMEEATIQMAYSTTKVITAIAVLQLVERGRIELDAPLTRYYAAHPYGDGVTIRQLLAHTSGVPDPMPLDWFAVEGRSFDRDQELRRLLARHARLRHAPGQRYGYSNLGYWLLEKAIEGASGQDYATYVEQNVFAPLDLSPAEARFSADGPGAIAVGHARRFSPVTWVLELMTPGSYWSRPHGRWARSARVSPYGRGYGGLLVTARALGRVLQDLTKDDSRLLGQASKAALFAPQHTGTGKPAGALGWVIGEVAGESYFGKQGGGLGFHGNVRIYPSRGIATVLLSNRTDISAGPIDARSDQLDTIFLAHEPSAVEGREP